MAEKVRSVARGRLRWRRTSGCFVGAFHETPHPLPPPHNGKWHPGSPLPERNGVRHRLIIAALSNAQCIR